MGASGCPGRSAPAGPSQPRRAEPRVSTLDEIGRHVGSAAFQRDAERANTHPPVLHTHDRWGNRIDEVEYDDAYHRIMAAASRRARTRRRGPTPDRARTSTAPRPSSSSRRSSRDTPARCR